MNFPGRQNIMSVGRRPTAWPSILVSAPGDQDRRLINDCHLVRTNWPHESWLGQ